MPGEPEATFAVYCPPDESRRCHKRKRDGEALSKEEIGCFIHGITDGTLPDYQASALLMAVVCRGMTPEETAWLTDAMVHSGVRLDLRDIPASRSTNTARVAWATRRPRPGAALRAVSRSR